MALTKLNIPTWLTLDYPSRLDNAPVIASTGKIVVNHLLDSHITNEQKFARGVTHLQELYSKTFDKSKKGYILNPEFISSNPSTAEIQAKADEIAEYITANAVIGDQFTEASSNAIPIGSYYTVATVFYQRLCQQLGITEASQNNFMGTYDSNLANFNPDFFKIVGTTGRNPIHERFENALKNQASARKKARNIDVGYYLSTQAEDTYFTSGLYNYCNSFNMMLYANDDYPLDWLYYGIFESQRKYAANSNAKCLWYTSPWMQSILTPATTQGTNSGWVHSRTGGYWTVPNWHVVPPSLMYQMAFLACLISEGVYLWEVGLVFSKEISDDRQDPFVPARSWISTGGNAPALKSYGTPYYPTYPEIGMDAAMAGVHTYASVKDIVINSTGIAYAPYTSTVNNVTTTVDYLPNIDRRLFRRGFQNFGQSSILNLANDKKGLALICTGTGKTLIIYINPYRNITQKETVKIPINGIEYNLGELEGDTLHIFVNQ